MDVAMRGKNTTGHEKAHVVLTAVRFIDVRLRPTFHQNNITPYAVESTDLLTSTDFPKTEFLMQFDTRGIFRKDSRLQRPYAFGLGLTY